MGKSSAERQREFRKRKQAAGLVPVSLLLPSRHLGAFLLLAERLRNDPDLEIGSVRNSRSGRLEKL